MQADFQLVAWRRAPCPTCHGVVGLPLCLTCVGAGMVNTWQPPTECFRPARAKFMAKTGESLRCPTPWQTLLYTRDEWGVQYVNGFKMPPFTLTSPLPSLPAFDLPDIPALDLPHIPAISSLLDYGKEKP